MRRARWNGNNVFPSQPRYAQAFNCPRETTSGTNLHNYASLNFAASLLIINGAFQVCENWLSKTASTSSKIASSLRTERNVLFINRAFDIRFNPRVSRSQRDKKVTLRLERGSKSAREITLKLRFATEMIFKDDEERLHERKKLITSKTWDSLISNY